MRLLKCDNAGHISFTEDLPGSALSGYRYAILSHVWGPSRDEVNYTDILRASGTQKKGYEKIRFCIQQTKQDGLEYFWVDTCCIDKTNSVELSSALISMFRWYAMAEKCYALITDVSLSAERWGQAFQSSRWFKRGWTLQELIAPSVVEFFSKDGKKFGTKTTLEKHINAATYIPTSVLRGQPLSEYTVHERQRWQEGRETREPEDMVYSLLGILNVSMPVLYGEGRDRAQARLDNEIGMALRGFRNTDFSLAFTLAEAIETDSFVGREREVKEIHQTLVGDGRRKTVVLNGLGGIGKTQLAIAYARRYSENYSAILWLNAESENSMQLGLIRIAQQIAREHPSTIRPAGFKTQADTQATINAVKAWLSDNANMHWLLICDNYDNPKIDHDASSATDSSSFELRRYLPDARHGAVLITTRSPACMLGRYIQLGKLTDLHESLRILEDSSNRRNLIDDPGAVRLAKKLDGSPLALTAAGWYLRQNRSIAFATYLDSFEQSWRELQKSTPELETYRNRALHSTWQTTLDQIEQQNPTSATLLRFWAFFDRRDLWYELLHNPDAYYVSLPLVDELLKDKITYENSIQVLCDYGLVEPSSSNKHGTESRGYNMDACLHAWITTALDSDQRQEMALAAMRCVSTHVRTRMSNNAAPLRGRLLDHVHRCCTFTKNQINPVDRSEFDELSVDRLCDSLEKTDEAESMYLWALKMQENLGHHDDERSIGIEQQLGCMRFRQGKMREAKVSLRRVLKWCETTQGPNHGRTLSMAGGVGALCLHLNQTAEAETLLLRALAGLVKQLGEDHADTLYALSNLGVLYQRQGKLSLAYDFGNRALLGYERVYGHNHPATNEQFMAVGNTFRSQAQHTKAEDMYWNALVGFERTPSSTKDMGGFPYMAGLASVDSDLRPKIEHADYYASTSFKTMFLLYLLTYEYVAQGDIRQAFEPFQRLLLGRDRLGPEMHPHIERLRLAIVDMAKSSQRLIIGGVCVGLVLLLLLALGSKK